MSPDVLLLYDLVATPSCSGQEQRAVQLLVDAMSARGFAAHVDSVGNAVGERTVPDAAGRIAHEIVLLGHIDTVPGAIPVRIDGGELHGRGAVDAKGSLAVFVAAAVIADLQPGTRVVVIGAVEEESATSRGARWAAAQYRPDACIIGEPSGWDGVTVGYKGRLLCDFTLTQPGGHSAGPAGSAVEVAVRWWQNVAGFARVYNAGKETLFDQLLPSLRSCNSASDGLYDRVEMRVGLRLPPNFSDEPLREVLQAVPAGATVKLHAFEPAFTADHRSPLATCFRQEFRARGVRARFKRKTGTSDMNVVGPIWGCPIVAYGPGDSKLDHTPSERLPLAEYESAVAILAGVLERWSRTRAPG